MWKIDDSGYNGQVFGPTLLRETRFILGPILAPPRRGVHVFRNNCPTIATTTPPPAPPARSIPRTQSILHSTSAVYLYCANLFTVPFARSVTILQLPMLPRDSSNLQLLTFSRQTRTNTRNPSANHEHILRIRARRQGICRRTCVFPLRAAQRVKGLF